jgi:hypothetical protein
MLKALALDNFWPSIGARKISGINVIKKVDTQGTVRFWISLSLMVISAVVLISYIYGVNQFANDGYQISSLQKQLLVLNDSNNKLNMQIATASSMVTIQSDFTAANFVPAGTPKFLQVPTVAER